jgi:hypothetical protein
MLTYRGWNYWWCFAFNPALGDVNTATLSNSKYGDKHRFIGVAQKNGVMVDKMVNCFYFEYTKVVVLITFMVEISTMMDHLQMT